MAFALKLGPSTGQEAGELDGVYAFILTPVGLTFAIWVLRLLKSAKVEMLLLPTVETRPKDCQSAAFTERGHVTHQNRWFLGSTCRRYHRTRLGSSWGRTEQRLQ